MHHFDWSSKQGLRALQTIRRHNRRQPKCGFRRGETSSQRRSRKPYTSRDEGCERFRLTYRLDSDPTRRVSAIKDQHVRWRGIGDECLRRHRPRQRLLALTGRPLFCQHSRVKSRQQPARRVTKVGVWSASVNQMRIGSGRGDDHHVIGNQPPRSGQRSRTQSGLASSAVCDHQRTNLSKEKTCRVHEKASASAKNVRNSGAKSPGQMVSTECGRRHGHRPAVALQAS